MVCDILMQTHTKNSKLSRFAFFFFSFLALCFFLKTINVLVIVTKVWYFSLIANFIGISILQKELKSKLYFCKTNLGICKNAGDKSQMMTKCHNWKVIYFAIIKWPRRYA